IPESNIIKDDEDVKLLHGWLEEDGSDGEFSLLFSSSRDGLSNVSFHSNCDNQGCTLTVIETTDGFVLGGYSNTPWTSSGANKAANKAFLFVLSGSDVAAPYKMKLENANDVHEVYHNSLFGPCFGGSHDGGHDLLVDRTNVYLRFGVIYESGPPGKVKTPNIGNYEHYVIKEMEVFQVSGVPAPVKITPKAANIQQEVPPMEPVSIFSNAINEAINTKQESLLLAEMEIVQLEESFEDEKNFVNTFASGESNDVIVLTTCEDSVLAQQFDDTKWAGQGRTSFNVKEWTPGDEITDRELFDLLVGGVKLIGSERYACLEETVEHHNNLHSLGLVEEPTLPVVRDSQKGRFEKVVKYYFPGDSAKVILG
ncbi:hypothetical protein ACHAWF_001705, partial [Thalassiosira exigua]